MFSAVADVSIGWQDVKSTYWEMETCILSISFTSSMTIKILEFDHHQGTSYPAWGAGDLIVYCWCPFLINIKTVESKYLILQGATPAMEEFEIGKCVQ